MDNRSIVQQNMDDKYACRDLVLNLLNLCAFLPSV